MFQEQELKNDIQDDEGKILGVFKKERIASYYWTVRNTTSNVFYTILEFLNTKPLITQVVV